MTYEQVNTRLKQESSFFLASFKALCTLFIYAMFSIGVLAFVALLIALTQIRFTYEVPLKEMLRVLPSQELPSLFMQNLKMLYFSPILFVLSLVLGVVVLVHMSTYYKRDFRKFTDPDYTRKHTSGYYHLSSILYPYLEQLARQRLDVTDIQENEKTGEYTITYNMHGKQHTIHTNNVKLLAVDAPQNFLRAKVIPKNIMWGYMQYDLYDIEIATTTMYQPTGEGN